MAKMILDNEDTEEVEINLDAVIDDITWHGDVCDCNDCNKEDPMEGLKVRRLRDRFSERLFDAMVKAEHWDENSRDILRDVKQYVRAVMKEAMYELRHEAVAPRTVLFEIIDKTINTTLPSYSSENASGMDTRAYGSPGYWSLKPNEVFAIPTNLIVEIPIGYEIQVRPRSGLALKGLTIANTPGTIDADYRGEIKILLLNRSVEPFIVETGDRIAQLVLCKVEKADVLEIGKVSDTKRGDGGFGHTGVK